MCAQDEVGDADGAPDDEDDDEFVGPATAPHSWFAGKTAAPSSVEPATRTSTVARPLTPPIPPLDAPPPAPDWAFDWVFVRPERDTPSAYLRSVAIWMSVAASGRAQRTTRVTFPTTMDGSVDESAVERVERTEPTERAAGSEADVAWAGGGSREAAASAARHMSRI
jgi:hypothetical protein